MSKKWENKNVIESFEKAVNGIYETIISERQMKIYAILSVVIMFLCLFYRVERMEFISMLISVVLIWITELLNTAIESCIDRYSLEYHELSKKAKDIAAGAVLVAVFNLIIVSYFVFWKRINLSLKFTFETFRMSYQHLVVFILVFLIVLIVFLKKFFGSKKVSSGGFPSGHGAVSSSIFVIINYLARDAKVFFLSLVLVILVLQSRIEGKIHNLKEILAGSVLGLGVTYLILILIF